jgi:hypothetical protein
MHGHLAVPRDYVTHGIDSSHDIDSSRSKQQKNLKTSSDSVAGVWHVDVWVGVCVRALQCILLHSNLEVLETYDLCNRVKRYVSLSVMFSLNSPFLPPFLSPFFKLSRSLSLARSLPNFLSLSAKCLDICQRNVCTQRALVRAPV